MRQDSARQILAQLLLHVAGKPALMLLARLREKRLEMLRDDAVEESVFWLVTLVSAATPGERSGRKAHDTGGERDPCRTALPPARRLARVWDWRELDSPWRLAGPAHRSTFEDANSHERLRETQPNVALRYSSRRLNAFRRLGARRRVADSALA